MPVREKNLYEHFAGLLEFPGEDIKLRVEECINALLRHPQYPPEAKDELDAFLQAIEMPLDDLQGIYSYTFELTAEYTLDIGSFLMEGFKRSNHLASLKAMYRHHNFPIDEVAKGELPDHLPIVLKFLARLEDEALKREILETFVIMGVEKLCKNLDKTRENVYRHLIAAISKVLEKDVKEVK